MYGDQWVDNKYYMGRDGRMVSGWYDCSEKSANYSSTRWMYFNADGMVKPEAKSLSDM